MTRERMKRRVLNKLHEELSLTDQSDKGWNRYSLWVDLALLDYDPEFSTEGDDE